MNWLIWMAIGLACGITIGYKDLGKKIELRIKQLFQEKKVRFIDENKEEISDDRLIRLLFPRKTN
ncbi:MAG: hypothetical protein N4A57_15485 [Anaeromicrobium sp.]|uniref:hypothetical protein n=1 Tax=Anaeromicrobium sp. TaxID=1929132 RepID=UPI0025D8417C|nr:hypothetical protein [Anaeromicrobium sp.]MCT4595650.1 hypothetical protein [Anaeromicrobium sp.]